MSLVLLIAWAVALLCAAYAGVALVGLLRPDHPPIVIIQLGVEAIAIAVIPTVVVYSLHRIIDTIRHVRLEIADDEDNDEDNTRPRRRVRRRVSQVEV